MINLFPLTISSNKWKGHLKINLIKKVKYVFPGHLKKMKNTLEDVSFHHDAIDELVMCFVLE